MRSRNTRERGFALLGTVLIVAVMVAAVSIAVRGSADGLAQNANLRQAELAHAAIDEGYAQVMNNLQALDVESVLTDPVNDWDIFKSAAAVDFLNVQYPPVSAQQHAYEQEFTIHAGLTLGQRTQA